MNEKWTSGAFFTLAAIGSAVGLGNIWRFSYVAGENGGGSFILVYLLSVALIGLPILLLELSAGRHFAASLSESFKKIGGRFAAFSLVPHALNFIILSYYAVITGWTLSYFAYSIFGGVAPLETLSQKPEFAVPALLTLALVAVVLRSGIQNGVEKANRILMPVFFAVLLIMLAYSFTLPGFGRAVSFLTNFGEIKISTMAAAVTQTLFSLSVGVGIMLTYAAYLKKREGIFKYAAVISVADTAVALLAGLVVFPIVFTYNLEPSQGPTLAFDSLPLAFSQMPLGGIIMPLFFFLLFSVAVTSVISMGEVAVAELAPKFGRKAGAGLVVLAIGVAAIPSLLSYSPVNLELAGMPVLDFLDGVIVSKFYPLVALVLVLVLGWAWKGFEGESKKILPKCLLKPYVLLVRFFIPVALGLLFISSIS